MKANIQVLFDMTFESEGKCQTQLSFKVPGCEGFLLPDSIQKAVLKEIQLVCATVTKADLQVLSVTKSQVNPNN